MWRCQIVGKINTSNNSVAKVNRFFDGYKWLAANNDQILLTLVMKELSKRKDNGYPWVGDSVFVITPMGQKYEVYIPLEEERQQRLKFKE